MNKNIVNYNKQGLLYGEYKRYYDDGKLAIETTCVNGEYHGEYKSYYNNGELSSETTYVNGKRHGIFKEYNDNNTLSGVEYYIKGNVIWDYFTEDNIQTIFRL